MQAVLVKQPGDSSQLTFGQVGKPEPKPAEILVKIKAIGVNRMDIVQREGRYPVPAGASQILGVEMSGVVESVGTDVTSFRVGDHVFGLMYGGAYAEFAVIDARMAMHIPEGITFEVAAAIPEACITAWQAVKHISKLQKGQDILIHAGASGVSTAAIQIACLVGARRIFTTAGSDKKLEHCRSLGATHTINYKEADFAEVIKRETDGRGVDVLVDYIGASYWQRNLDSLALDGHMVLLGFLSGVQLEKANIGPILFKRLTIQGSTLRSRSVEYQQHLAEAVEKHVMPKIVSGDFKVVVDKVFSWKQVAEAHRYMEGNHNMGKVVLTIGDE
ncbi:hypothetical protein IWQ60_006102 [Tieghemiomyces parasiticus]|uniref:Enoyl reductase (ER) domain-containing protein n=1 Tax=Tieghemiomyces parasiticus TaxID=78921 RepID=A0A9W8ADL1_9FUNG|nr:hypothetical protein IWQ60_006102 [Tieghemiomyces parasiticus]